jgi:hypothetical protein
MKRLPFLFLLVSFFANSQDLLFLNSNQSLINLNPSFAGSNGLFRNQNSIRTPFPKNPSKWIAAGSTFDMYLPGIKGALAISLSDNVWYGHLISQELLTISYAQYLSFYKSNLKVIPSLQVIQDNRRISSDWIDNKNTPTPKRQILFGGGLLVNYKNKLYIGTYFREQWNSSNYSLGPAIVTHATYTAKLNESMLFQVSGRISSQPTFSYCQIGINSIFQKRIVAGVQYISYIKSPVFNLGYRGDLFSVVAGYDFAVSKLAGNYNGYAELHFSYNLRQKGNRHPSTMLSFENF